MAKKSKIAKNEKRKEIVARYAERRQELKAIIKNPNVSDEERLEAQFKLNRQPRDASPVRSRRSPPRLPPQVRPVSCPYAPDGPPR